MHRKSLLTAACALAAALVVGVTGPGQAQPTSDPAAAHPSRIVSQMSIHGDTSTSSHSARRSSGSEIAVDTKRSARSGAAGMASGRRFQTWAASPRASVRERTTSRRKK